MKATAVGPANIALIKYWGKKDEIWRIPENGSISINLSNLTTTTTVEFADTFSSDRVIVNEKLLSSQQLSRVIKHIDRIRKLAGSNQKARVVSTFNFPMATGLSSSASGFAALTVAGVKAAGLHFSEKELSILARIGSGSACRSIPSGFVEWLDGDTNETSYAISIFPPGYWDIVDLAVVVSEDVKEVPSSQGQKLHATSPFFATRLRYIDEKIAQMKQLIKNRNFLQFGELVESEALELHAIMLTSQPSLIYWTSGTLALMKLTKIWRSEGLPVYFTINTGQNIHLLCEGKNAAILKLKLQKLDFVKQIIVNQPAVGARLTDKHLF